MSVELNQRLDCDAGGGSDLGWVDPDWQSRVTAGHAPGTWRGWMRGSGGWSPSPRAHGESAKLGTSLQERTATGGPVRAPGANVVTPEITRGPFNPATQRMPRRTTGQITLDHGFLEALFSLFRLGKYYAELK